MVEIRKVNKNFKKISKSCQIKSNKILNLSDITYGSLTKGALHSQGSQAFSEMGDIMFHVFVKGIDEPADVVWDVHAAFGGITLYRDDGERLILQRIDKASYCDGMHFLDRNGAKTSLMYLSSGAKAALLVYHFREKVINCIEVGSNALSALFKATDTGNIIVDNRKYLISDRGALDTSIQYRGHCFSSVREFSDYLAYMWLEPLSRRLMDAFYEDYN